MPLAWLLLGGAFLLAGTSDPHVFDVPYRNQLDGSSYAQANCGPAALSMALAYYGVDASAGELRVRAMKAQHSWITDDGGYSDEYGVFVYNLAAVAEELGIHANGLWMRDGGRLDHFHAWQSGELRREVMADHPVILQVTYRALPDHGASRSLDDHYIVVHGSAGADFVYSDPLGVGERGSAEVIGEEDLFAAMALASAPRAGFAVVKPGK
jgi:hypothetical protein